MCLAVPGKIISQNGVDDFTKTGRVSFGGIVKEVNLSFVPEVRIGDYVIVHVGFAIARLNEEEAQKIFQYLKELDDLEELKLPGGEAA